MTPIPTDPILGVSCHSAGAFAAANCYVPQKYVRRWSWETYWAAQAAWCWIILPIVGAFFTIPDLWQVIQESPKDRMFWALLMGIAFGIGGTTFNIAIRYMGFSLTYAISIGLSAVLGTLVPPIVRGQVGEILARPGAHWIVLGILGGIVGISLCGLAGRWKEHDLAASSDGPIEFSLMKGLILSLIAGVSSAIYGLSIEVAQPIIDVAEQHGAGYWKCNVAYVFANPGAFITSIAYCLYLAKKNRSLGELFHLKAEGQGGSLFSNHVMAALTGAMWYGQFLFYSLGRAQMGRYAFTSWAIQMILLVLFTNVLGVVFREWKGSKTRTLMAVSMAIAVLVGSILMLTYGNYLGSEEVSVVEKVST